MTQPDFIIIPTQLLSDAALQPSDRVLFGYIYWMTKLALLKCVASNVTLAGMTGLSERGVRGSLERLERQGYIARIYLDGGNRHRAEIVCQLAFSAVNASSGGTNVPSRRNKRAVTDGTNVPHNKKREIEDLNRSSKSKDLLVKSETTSRTYRTLFADIVVALGFSDKVRPTKERLRKLSSRNKVFSYDELVQSARNLGLDAYMQGENDSGKRYGDIDYFLRNDEHVDKYLNRDELKMSVEAF